MRAILEEARKEHLTEVVLHISNSNPMEPFTTRAAVQYGSHRLLQALRVSGEGAHSGLLQTATLHGGLQNGVYNLTGEASSKESTHCLDVASLLLINNQFLRSWPIFS